MDVPDLYVRENADAIVVEADRPGVDENSSSLDRKLDDFAIVIEKKNQRRFTC